MVRSETVAAIRLGFGFHPEERAADSPDRLIAELSYSVPTPRLTFAQRAEAFRGLRRAMRQDDAKARQKARRSLREIAEADLRETVARAVSGPGFAERLVHFWADHFTVAANCPALRLAAPDFVASAIRPHVARSFPSMLKGATFHPAMLLYLDQAQSVGPTSRAGRRRIRGLNENLAREMLELHTLGSSALYTQDDVHALAELLTGLSVDRWGFRFRQRIAEPGAKTILGRSYGPPKGIATIEAALEDIALHPDTAHHIAHKLAVHFIGPDTTPGHVEGIARAYIASEGDLISTYRALLDHPAAWLAPFQKAKRPFDFLVSALRAAGTRHKDVLEMPGAIFRKGILEPLATMGQPLFRPGGPDGWSEEAEAWITPAGLSARISWAADFAERALSDHDPRHFVETALRDAASDNLRSAVSRAGRRSDGIALALASPEFNRR